MPSVSNVSRVHDFTQSIGVNTHISWKSADSSYNDPSITLRSLTYLGATHVRDGVPFENWTLPEYVAIAQTGIKFDMLVSSPTLDMSTDLARIGRLVAAVPGSVAAIEGVNEFNTNDVYLDGVNSRGNPAWAQLYGPKLWAAVKADPALANVEVIAASLAGSGASDLAKQGSVESFSDSANWHTYFGQGDQPAQQMATNFALAKSTSPNEKVTITETGYYTAVDAMDWGGGGVSQAVQAITTLNIFLDAYKSGVDTTYIYELLDNISGPATNDLENNFGLFLGDGTPKAAATAIHNLTTILADKTATAATFATGTLDMTVTGLSPTGSTMTMQKSDGSFDIVVWDEPDVWNQPTKSAINPAGQPVTVTFGATYGTVKVYDPLVGTAATRTLTNVDRVELSLGSHPYIIEVPATPAGPVVTPAPVVVPAGPASPVTLGSGANTLALSVNEDAYQGDAQFTVSVDGTQIGGTQTGTASRAAGQAQVFNVKGNFGVGAHTATVNFLNDAWGGTAATDRNLFVNSATLDGAAISNGALTLLSNGPKSFSFNGAAPVNKNTLVLQVSEDAWQGDAQFTVKIDGATIGGVQTATASHAAGASQTVSLAGNWGAGPHSVAVAFINDAYGGTATTDRNLYVERVTYDGQVASGGPATLLSAGTANFAVPAASTLTALTLHLAEDAWQGDAQYSVLVDGKALGEGGVVTASNALGQSQAVALQAALSAGTHDVAVSFLNDAWGGTAATDRNLYVKGIDVNGASVPNAGAALMSAGTAHFQIVVASP